MSDNLFQTNQQVAGLILQLAGQFPPRTAGLVVRKLDDLEAGARAWFGPLGAAAVDLIRFALGLALVPVMVAGLFWSTLGSAAVMVASPTMLWGYSGTNMNGLGLGMITAFANTLVTVLAMAFILHLFIRPPERDVFGEAKFEDEQRQAGERGLR